MQDAPIVTEPECPPVFRLPETPVTDADPLPLAGSGIHALAVCPGLSLTFTRFEPESPMEFLVESPSAPISICCYLSGTRHHRYEVAGGAPLECVTEAGSCTICRLTDLHGEFTVDPGECQSAIGLQVSPELLSQWLPSEALKTCPRLHPLVADEKTPHVFHQKATPPEIRTVLHQVVTCPLEGAIRRMYLQGKAMELLSLHLAALIRPVKDPDPDPVIKSRILEAAKILEQEMVAPPTIAKLSRRVGLNECRLKAGFREIFGTTVFGYLQHHRMQEARKLMETRGRNVSEAAWDVGYTNVSHFIAAFKKTFGITPGELLKSI